jgi:hypothetical protein
VRNYVPQDDGLEPTDFDEYYDYPAHTAKELAARVYVKIERDPERAARLEKRQNAAIIEMLQWMYDKPGPPRVPAHRGASRCARRRLARYPPDGGTSGQRCAKVARRGRAPSMSTQPVSTAMDAARVPHEGSRCEAAPPARSSGQKQPAERRNRSCAAHGCL